MQLMHKPLVLLVALTICGCTTPSQPTDVQPSVLTWPRYQKQLTHMNSWEILGAVAIRDSERTSTAILHWQQTTANTYQIELVGPLGSNSLLLSVTPSHATLITNGQQLSANTAEALLQHQTGMQFPVSQLYYWIRGLPAPATIDTLERTSSSPLQHLVQLGWNIHYLEYKTVNHLTLPSKLMLTNGKLTIKIAINRWLF